MVDDLLYGRVTSFRREQGFGVITLEDGRDVKFDASDCTMVPEEGAAVRLRVGPARWGGGFKALHVEPRGSSTLFVPAHEPTLDERIAALQREHLVSALSEHAMTRLVAEAFEGSLGAATLLDVLDAFYLRSPASARTDGYFRHNRRFHDTSDDVLAEIAALVPGGAVPRQISLTLAGTIGRIGRLHTRLPGGGEHILDVESLDDIVFLVNDALREAGDPRRVYPLETDGGWHANLVLSADRAARLAKVLPFATEPHAIN